MNFSEEFQKIEGLDGKILFKHVLFEEQEYYCESFNIINDNERIGLIIKNQEIFINKKDIKKAYILERGVFVVSDSRLTITIICE